MAALNYTTMMPVYGGAQKSGFLLDGDYSRAYPIGAPVPHFPFLNQGDTETVIFRQKCEQALVSYAPLDLTKPYPGVSGAYPLGDVNFRDVGCGLVEFERMYGNIPKQRIRRGQSHTYAFQTVLSSGVKISGAGTDNLSYEGPQYSIGTEPAMVDSRLVMDYFIDGQQANFPLVQAPKVIQVGQTIQTWGQDFAGGPFPLYVDGSCVCATGGIDILAENDSYADWEGAIKCRVRRIIAGPTPAFWNSNVG